MALKVTDGLDLDQTSLINAVLHPVSSDPTTPTDGQVWYRSDTDRLMIRRNGENKALALLDDVTGGAITGALWDAQSVVVAIADDSPAAQVIGENEVLGRAAGGDIGALSAAQLRTVLGIEAGATADQSAAEIKAAYESNADTNEFSDAEQSKLAGITAGAEPNAVDSVNTQTGAVVLDPDDLDDTSTAHKFATAAQLSKIDGVESGATADQTPAELLAALITVDGPASGLDADTLDGAQLSTLATITYVDTEISTAVSDLVGGAPAALDTLNELAAALADDASYSASINAALALRTQKYAEDIGDGATTDIAVTHNLGTTDVVVQVKEVATSEVVLADVTITSANVVTIGFGTAPASNAYRVVVIG